MSRSNWKKLVPKPVKWLHAWLRNLHPDTKFIGPLRGRDQLTETLNHPLLHVERERLRDAQIRYLNLLHEILDTHAPEQVDAILEWGTGHSTSYFFELAQRKNSGLLLSLDPYGPYQEAFRKRLPKATFFELKAIDLISDGPEEERKRYNFATYPETLQRRFDVIFVDGRRRNECLLAATRIVSDTGIIILHDASRVRYEMGCALFEEVAYYPKCNGFRVMMKKTVIPAQAGI